VDGAHQRGVAVAARGAGAADAAACVAGVGQPVAAGARRTAAADVGLDGAGALEAAATERDERRVGLHGHGGLRERERGDAALQHGGM